MKQNQLIWKVFLTVLLILSFSSTIIFSQSHFADRKFNKAENLGRSTISKFMINPIIKNNFEDSANPPLPDLFKAQRLSGIEPAIDSIVILAYDTSYQWIKYSYDYDDYGYLKEYFGEYTDNGVKGYYEDYHFEYRPDGRLLSKLILDWNNGVWIKSRKSTYTYDPNGNIILYLQENWDTTLTTWVNKYKVESSYDARNNTVLKVFSNWNSGAWQLSSKYENTFDGNNNITSEVYYTWESGAWQENSKYEWTYDGNNNKTSAIYYSWSHSAWENDFKTTYTYDTNNNMLSKNEFVWNNSTNQWENYYWYLFTFDSNGNETYENRKKWDSGTANWVNDSRANLTYNSKGKILTRLIEDWEGSNWHGAYQDEYTYDINNHMLTTTYYDNWNGNGWDNGDRYSFVYNTDGLCKKGTYETWFTNHWVSDDGFFYIPEFPRADSSYLQFFSPCINGYEYNVYYRTITDVNEDNNPKPNSFSLSQNYPNPFNPSTIIKYQIPNSGYVSLNIYDVLGEEVASLVDKNQPAGSYEINFNASNLTSGVYFYQLKFGKIIQVKKMTLLR